MIIKRYVRSYLFYIVVGLLVVSVLTSVIGVGVLSKNQENVSQNTKEELKAANEQLASLEAQLKEQTKAKEKAENDLKKAQNQNKALIKEKKVLENENKVYKKKIEKLSAKEKAEMQSTIAETNSPQEKYPKPTKVCYLTFDDGPSDNTLKILKILKKYDAKATFFVIGTAKLEYLPKIKNAGHAIALHSNSHDYSNIYKSRNAFFADLNKISAKVEAKIGEKVTLMRFPGDSSNIVSKKYCKGVMTDLVTQVKMKGYSYFDWNVDSGDASGHNVPAKTITKNVLTQAEKKDSICVLMHDTKAKNTTVKALPGILEGLKKQGYKFEVLTEKSHGYHFKVNN
jgi:peptidoglycan/xylan/chitin deacetylase (PgdA/CDA1 family)